MSDDNPWDVSGVGTTWTQNGQYDAAGRMTRLDLLSSVVVSGAWDTYVSETKSYNANGQLTSLAWSGSGIQYVFSSTQNNGQITQEVQAMSGETISYAYDALKRLTSATSVNTSTSAAIWNQQFQYDGFGNLTGKGPTGSITSISATAATNRLSSATYDANGNMTSGAGASLTYDESNRLSSATPLSGGTEYYGYAPNNKRIYRWTAAGNEEWTLYGINGERLGTFTLDPTGFSTYQLDSRETNVWFGGKLVSTMNTGYNQMVARDRLGSRSPGNYKPYGEEKIATPNDQEKFATYLRDSFTGLDYADQRYYASSYGRFNTVDRGSPNSKDPASWNRYSYTGGDPINRNDKHGTCYEDGNGHWAEDNDLFWEAVDGGYGMPIDFATAEYYEGKCVEDPMYVALSEPELCKDGGVANGLVSSDPGGCESSSSPPETPVGQSPPPQCPLMGIVGNYTTTGAWVVYPEFSPNMAALIDEAFSILNIEGIIPQINSGYRSVGAQANIPPNNPNGVAPPGQSWHNVGLAVDIQLNPATQVGQEIIAAMESVGLTWGGNLTKLVNGRVVPKPDKVHFQWPGTVTHRNGTVTTGAPSSAQVAACQTEHPLGH